MILSKEFSDFSWVGLQVKEESELTAEQLGLCWCLLLKPKIQGGRSGCCFSGELGEEDQI